MLCQFQIKGNFTFRPTLELSTNLKAKCTSCSRTLPPSPAFGALSALIGVVPFPGVRQQMFSLPERWKRKCGYPNLFKMHGFCLFSCFFVMIQKLGSPGSLPVHSMTSFRVCTCRGASWTSTVSPLMSRTMPHPMPQLPDRSSLG